jgi:hypothetical protein
MLVNHVQRRSGRIGAPGYCCTPAAVFSGQLSQCRGAEWFRVARGSHVTHRQLDPAGRQREYMLLQPVCPRLCCISLCDLFAAAVAAVAQTQHMHSYMT